MGAKFDYAKARVRLAEILTDMNLATQADILIRDMDAAVTTLQECPSCRSECCPHFTHCALVNEAEKGEERS